MLAMSVIGIAVLIFVIIFVLFTGVDRFHPIFFIVWVAGLGILFVFSGIAYSVTNPESSVNEIQDLPTKQMNAPETREG